MRLTNQDQGTRWENRVCQYLTAELPPPASKTERISRTAQTGSRDRGDLTARPFSLECKDQARHSVPAWLRQADAGSRAAAMPYSAVVVKIRGRRTGLAQVAISIRTFTRLRMLLGLDTTMAAVGYGFRVSLRGLDTSRWYMVCDLETFAVLLQDVRDARR
ncbi:hypothetical protein OHV05_04410 [Kitasatospora sp. NBC_00070]|uniref:hypothetical protein n=1 Tax=Kitasatospora sp. NBC_00070 TaxID=2975962 RepID=UPI003251CFA4